MNKIKYFILCLFTFSCSDSDDNPKFTLESYSKSKSFETGAVIACAASDNMDTTTVLIFYYPKLGTSNFRLYQTASTAANKDDFKNYQQVMTDSQPVFNGYLQRFSQNSLVERWYIVTFEIDNEIKISNPIRSQQITKPTVWEDIVTVNQDTKGMPSFKWKDNFTGDNAIYFQILSDIQDNLLSGTYTYQPFFQFYKLDNVVLNVTRETPPVLVPNNTYRFTLMDVSLDNWVNLATLNKNFVSE